MITRDWDEDDPINPLIDECIDQLCDDNAEFGAESLAELAQVWAKSGLGMQSFLNVRQYIVNTAKDRIGNHSFIDYKLKLAERELTKTRAFTHGNTTISSLPKHH